MDVTVSHTAPLYAGTSLTLTCTVTLVSNVDNGERVMTEWSGPRDISGERHSETDASGSGSTYTGSLTISPLADQDDGTYTCTGTVTGGTSVQQANASSDVTIDVIGKNYVIVLLYHYLPSPPSPCLPLTHIHSSPSSRGFHISCQRVPHCWPDLLPHLLCAGSTTSGGGAQYCMDQAGWDSDQCCLRL